MSFSDKKEQQLKEQPKIETKIFKSKTGSHIVYQTIITETKAVEYMQTILDNDPLEQQG